MAHRTSSQAKFERTEYAKQLIIANPTWGKDKINKAVRARYKVGLRRVDVARLKEVTLIGRPKAQTGWKPIKKIVEQKIITPVVAERVREFKVAVIGFDVAYHLMRSAGFLDGEIRETFGAPNVPALFGTDAFKTMLKDRRAWFMGMLRQGISKAQVVGEIKAHYLKPKRDVFDFLRAGYDYKQKEKLTEAEYRYMQRKQALGKVKDLYHGTKRKRG